MTIHQPVSPCLARFDKIGKEVIGKLMGSLVTWERQGKFLPLRIDCFEYDGQVYVNEVAIVPLADSFINCGFNQSILLLQLCRSVHGYIKNNWWNWPA